MPALVSPGVSVTVTNESFFIPASAPTVPLFLVTTAEDKKQNPSDPTSSYAEGTREYGVIRTITSLQNSVQMYGIPRFLESPSGEPHHGDARNEYGLAALNAFLGLGSFAYVIRANVNLNDNFEDLQALWDYKIQVAQSILENLVNEWINNYNIQNQVTPGDPGYKVTIPRNDLYDLMQTATDFIWDAYSFSDSNPSNSGNPLRDDFFIDHTASPLPVYADGYDQPTTGDYLGIEKILVDWETGLEGSTSGFEAEWTAQEAGNTLVGAADDFKWTEEFLFKTSLGADDSDRRVAIIEALREIVASNEEIRSENFEYNLILCPGYPELAPDMLYLVTSHLKNEVFIIADTPMAADFEELRRWATTLGSVSATEGAQIGALHGREIHADGHLAYYYPHVLATNLDGKSVLVPASAWALRTYAYSDNVAYQWFAPAGIRRGTMTGVLDLGYVEGTLGTPTQFKQLHPNQGQRDNMYAYEAMGGINPLVAFPGRGFLVWGQKTSTGQTASALDRVNVSRLIKYIARSLRKGALPFVFEPNDQLTRDNLKAFVDGFLSDLIVKRALYDFATICDESNNTPIVIDRNELVIDVALKPVKAAEFIIIPIRVVSTGAQI